jgi:hypothetical protein
MAYPTPAMQIRPGVSLLQAISRAAEPRPVPFAERLAEVGNGGARVSAAQTPSGPVGARESPAVAVAPSEPGAAAQQTASRQNPVPRPRGSLVDIVV